MSYMMINLAQVSPPRQQVRIDGMQEDYPSSWAGGMLSEFGKSVPNQGPVELGEFAVLFGGVTGNQWQALKVNVVSVNSERQSPTPASVRLRRSTGEIRKKKH